MKIQSVLFLLSLAVAPGQAFVPVSTPSSSSALGAESETSFVDTIQKAFEIAQSSNAEGFGFKQIIADVLAGDDFDKEAVAQEIEETIASAPCGK